MDHRDRIGDLLAQVSTAGDEGKLAIYEEAIEIADSHNDLYSSMWIRMQYVQLGLHDGIAPEKAMVAFSWMLAARDRDPENEGVKYDHLLWMYKWVLGLVRSYSQLTLERIEGLFADAERRYREEGLSPRPIYKLRAVMELNRGNLDGAMRWRWLWLAAPTDGNNDCTACEIHSEVRWHLDTEKLETAFELAEPLLSRRHTCSHLPALAWSNLLLPALRLGRGEEAMEFHRLGSRRPLPGYQYVAAKAKHATFAALTGNHARAGTLLMKWLPEMWSCTVDLDRYLSLRYADVVLADMEAGNNRPRKVQMPKKYPGWNEQGVYTIAELRQACAQEANRLGEAFDRRNGTSYVSTMIPPAAEWEKYRVDVPFTR